MNENDGGARDIRNERLDEYVARFGGPPPLLYMADLSDADFAAQIAEAIDSGVAITAEKFELEASDRVTVY